ncbi:IS3 family transposase [Janibacter massiliensis]|uniref:IS3 family transposase n=1 Tax=Janibacter massiliensis TaxID=2058291 RepID=UPI000D0E3523|nr:IS3 family transposase [Janibacter massiliensis]
MSTGLVRELAAEGFPVAVTCRVLNIPRSSYYDSQGRAPSARAAQDAALSATIATVHAASRGTYGAPRVHAELRLGMGVAVGRKRVARLMRQQGSVGVCHHRKGRGHRPVPAVHEDLVQRRFVADAPDRVWFTDVTQHRAADGWVYCCAVIDACTRRVVGWSIADHIRSELVVDALQMARWQRRPPPGTIVHSDRGSAGGFNWSSQHLDHGGVQGWRRATGVGRPAMYRRGFVGSGVRIGRCARQCVRLDGPSPRGRCSDSSGG